jgi:hypothetical protein
MSGAFEIEMVGDVARRVDRWWVIPGPGRTGARAGTRHGDMVISDKLSNHNCAATREPICDIIRA